MINLEKLKEFREHILDLAIRGKLVEQRPEEGTAEDLYQQIQEEKSKLIKEGKLKKEKPLVPIENEEIPFDIPEDWKWVHIRDISLLVTKGTTPRGGNVAYIDKGIGFLRAENVNGLADLNLSKLKYVSDETHKNELKRSILESGDILVTIAGTLGRTAIVKNTDLPLNANQAISIVRMVLKTENAMKYVVYALNANTIQQLLLSQTKQSAIPNLTLEIIGNCLIPLPPLAEQKRIASKIESYLSVIDKAEELLKRKVDLDGQIKEKILQMAIQGKLVEQRPEEGTAEDLYQQIQEEKTNLIKEGKLKKEKPLAPIEDDEIPFDIPDSWRWVRIGDLYKHNTGKALNSSNIEGKKLPYITTSNLYWNRFELNNLKKMFFKESEIEKCSVQKGDLLVCEGGDIGRAAIWNFDYQVCIQNHIHKLRGYIQLSTLFYYYIFLYYKLNNSISGRGIGIQGLSSNALHNLVVPLPPLVEQKRIVAKIEELLALCDKLKLK